MASYVYEGGNPRGDGDGGLVRPGDVREFDSEPAWGPWRLLEAGDPLLPPEPPQAVPDPPPAPRAVPVTPGSPAASTPPLKLTGTEG